MSFERDLIAYLDERLKTQDRLIQLLWAMAYTHATHTERSEMERLHAEVLPKDAP